VPDFWDSKPISKPQTAEPRLPKLVIIAGADTHHGGGPSHNLLDEHRHSAHLTDSHIVPAPMNTTVPSGLLQDIVQDLGVSSSVNLPSIKGVAGSFSQAKEKPAGQSRDLNKDEIRGLWILLGLLAGSWVLGGLVNGTPTKREPAGGQEHIVGHS
jgi:hypothetical protein